MRSPDFIEFDTLHYSYGDMFAKHFLAQVIIKFQYDIECLKLLNTLFRNLILSFFTHSRSLVKHTAKRTQFLLQISTCFLYTSQFFLYLRQPFFKRAGKRRFWYEHKYMVQLVSRNSIFCLYRYIASINIPLQCCILQLPVENAI